ncbi:uncharacterized protein VTP21DRAFT_2576 [Calcarisporiella thermophila]|uniref:uncharacterized protein n=1 Tax=Calcarisporiella thermophila TaxID=911321 RepID=UPI003743E917
MLICGVEVVAVWQLDWFMTAMGGLLLYGSLIQTLYFKTVDCSYQLETVQRDNNNIAVQLGEDVTLVVGKSNEIEGLCRSKIIAREPPTWMAWGFALHGVLQVLGNLVLVPNGGAYAQFSYLVLLLTGIIAQTLTHGSRTRAGPTAKVLSATLATRAEAVAYAAYITRLPVINIRNLGIINLPEAEYDTWWKNLSDYVDEAARTLQIRPLNSISTDYYATDPGETNWAELNSALRRGVNRARSHWPMILAASGGLNNQETEVYYNT